MRYFLSTFAFLFLFGNPCFGQNAHVAPASKILVQVVLEINNSVVPVSSGMTQSLVWGDIVKIVGADVADDKGQILSKLSDLDVNFVGYANHNLTSPINDIGYVIRTNDELLEKWARDDEHSLFEIKALVAGVPIGSIFVKLNQPELKYVVFEVNEREEVLREGGILSLKSSDRFSVKRFETNMTKSGDGIKFYLRPIDSTSKASFQIYEMIFLRYDREFASLPIHLAF